MENLRKHTIKHIYNIYNFEILKATLKNANSTDYKKVAMKELENFKNICLKEKWQNWQKTGEAIENLVKLAKDLGNWRKLAKGRKNDEIV